MLITFQESELICKMFRQYVMDRDLDIRDDDECRCAIKVFVNHIQNVLADYYDVEPKEQECWEIEQTVVYSLKEGEE